MCRVEAWMWHVRNKLSSSGWSSPKSHKILKSQMWYEEKVFVTSRWANYWNNIMENTGSHKQSISLLRAHSSDRSHLLIKIYDEQK